MCVKISNLTQCIDMLTRLARRYEEELKNSFASVNVYLANIASVLTMFIVFWVNINVKCLNTKLFIVFFRLILKLIMKFVII